MRRNIIRKRIMKFKRGTKYLSWMLKGRKTNCCDTGSHMIRKNDPFSIDVKGGEKQSDGYSGNGDG
jgi:hypothetical protein